MANEGNVVVFTAPDAAQAALAVMRRHPLGRESAVIGRVTEQHPRMVVARTAIGTNRVVPMQIGGTVAQDLLVL